LARYWTGEKPCEGSEKDCPPLAERSHEKNEERPKERQGPEGAQNGCDVKPVVWFPGGLKVAEGALVIVEEDAATA
jgi:hypothetical protein